MTRAAQILMCPPDYYGIEYEINPVDGLQPSDRSPVGRTAVAGPATVCWNNWALRSPACRRSPVCRTWCLRPMRRWSVAETAILSHFRYPQRRGEEPHCQRWLSEHGFQVQRLRSPAFFEGAGDALFCGDTLFAGYRIRSDVAAFHEIGDAARLPRDPAGTASPLLLPSRYLFLSLGPGRGDLLSRRPLTTTAARCFKN